MTLFGDFIKVFKESVSSRAFISGLVQTRKKVSNIIQKFIPLALLT